ncbi:MAG: hypothetical protein KatS3mg105_4845 [Gemmatales bacterium]|nr:MAG: hypothetical protein KatS3mg105_4845 [Gemmatales bacterium]
MNVLFLAVEGLQLAYLGCYGNDEIDTPAVDRLAAEGIVFDRHILDQIDPPGWRTGRYSLLTLEAESSPPAVDLVDVLRREGVSVFEFASPAACCSAMEQLTVAKSWFGIVTFPSLLPPWQIDTAELDEESSEWPIVPAPPIGVVDEAERRRMYFSLKRTYSLAVEAFDADLLELLESLRQSGVLDNTLLVLFSTRGLALAEHGIVGDCRPWLYEEVAHLPLICRLPKSEQAGRHVRALTQPVDWFATVLECFEINAPQCHGRSLFPLMHSVGFEWREFAVSGWQVGSELEWALRSQDWAYRYPVREGEEEPSGHQLFVKPEDRWEVNDVAGHHLELAESFAKTLSDFVKASRQPGPLPAMTLPADSGD